MVRRPSRKWKTLRFIALALTTIAGGTLGFSAFVYHQLSAQVHFRNLSVVGNSPRTNGTESPPAKQTNLPGTFNVAIIGSDARPGDKISHSDTIVLIHVDLNHHAYNMISLPRDTRTYFPGYGYTKLTTIQYINEAKYGVIEGIQETVSTLSQVTKIPINYYAETNFWGLQDMVNTVGGIEIDLPFPVRLTHPWHKNMKGQVFTRGTHFLNGVQTIEVVRERDSVPGGDYGRQLLQEKALIGIAQQVLKPANISRLPALARALPNFLIATNLSTEDLVSLGLSVRGNFHPDTQMHYFQIPSISEYVHDDVLQAANDELLLNQKKLKSVIQNYFLSNGEELVNGADTWNDTDRKTDSNGNTSNVPGSANKTLPADNPGSELLDAPSEPEDFGPLGDSAPAK